MTNAYHSSFIHIAQLDRRFRQWRDVGWVYVMRNQMFREPLLKIGKSSRPPHIRALELGKETSAPSDFEVVFFIHASNHHAAEALAHRELQQYRKSRGKEFFSAPLPLAIQTLARIADSYPVYVGPQRARTVLPQPFEVVRFLCPRCGAANQIRQLLVPVSIRCGACKGQIDAPAS